MRTNSIGDVSVVVPPQDTTGAGDTTGAHIATRRGGMQAGTIYSHHESHIDPAQIPSRIHSYELTTHALNLHSSQEPLFMSLRKTIPYNMLHICILGYCRWPMLYMCMKHWLHLAARLRRHRQNDVAPCKPSLFSRAAKK